MPLNGKTDGGDRCPCELLLVLLDTNVTGGVVVTVVIMTTGDDPELDPRTEFELPNASILADLLALEAGNLFDSDLVNDRSMFNNNFV